jgi:ABC-type phosphate/phosphonate transport system substrate-binding protein
MIASLPMYDLPEIRATTDAWWRGLSGHMGIKGELDRGPDRYRAWRDPDLVFSQTCGYPLTHEFRGRLRLLATPHYAADGCAGPNYCSIIFAREEVDPVALRGRIAAYNSTDSMSGMLALKLVFAPHADRRPFFAGAIATGSHVNSLAAVKSGEAQVCAIDAVTAALVRHYRSELLDGLVEIARSPQVPALPFVTSTGRPASEVARIGAALQRAFSDPALAEAREALLLTGLSVLSDDDYERIVELERETEAMGGLTLWR